MKNIILLLLISAAAYSQRIIITDDNSLNIGEPTFQQKLSQSKTTRDSDLAFTSTFHPDSMYFIPSDGRGHGRYWMGWKGMKFDSLTYAAFKRLSLYRDKYGDGAIFCVRTIDSVRTLIKQETSTNILYRTVSDSNTEVILVHECKYDSTLNGQLRIIYNNRLVATENKNGKLTIIDATDAIKALSECMRTEISIINQVKK